MLSRLSFGWAWAWLGLLTWSGNKKKNPPMGLRQGRLAGRIDWLGLDSSGQVGRQAGQGSLPGRIDQQGKSLLIC
ncbi:hypothetical protein PPACK8108_LOCUS20931 [Phakopsora pachyrhizi]|uniref:Secreted protein n=1 Tax=Phakopsora pachyrhizi TaxID=170000 RepID=A0AAV0BL57_PHAPC|nr:hypothetical protein PPACK8108_LOCUS20931 [Phakopsora pachyrhizi]